jgi:hypothetical protein
MRSFDGYEYRRLNARLQNWRGFVPSLARALERFGVQRGDECGALTQQVCHAFLFPQSFPMLIFGPTADIQLDLRKSTTYVLLSGLLALANCVRKENEFFVLNNLFLNLKLFLASFKTLIVLFFCERTINLLITINSCTKNFFLREKIVIY